MSDDETMTSAARVEALLAELGLTDRTTRVAAPDFVVATAKIADRPPDGDRQVEDKELAFIVGNVAARADDPRR
jgi:hypothetical protein